MTNLDKLIRYFEDFPGIGARQARRFAFHILTLPPQDTSELAHLIAHLKQHVRQCEHCQRFFAYEHGTSAQCRICSDPNRDHSKLMIVAKDTDITPIERAGAYDGLYFVLGGTLPLLSDQTNTLRTGALRKSIDRQLQTDLQEIILAFPVNPDGENTARFVLSLIDEHYAKQQLRITQLGRGLSTGSELEYADPETIKSALKNRT